MTFRERPDLVASAEEQEPNPLNQLRVVFFDPSSGGTRTALFLLASVFCFSATVSGVMNFGSSWLVSTAGAGESQAASTMGLATLGNTLVALHAGYFAARALGRRGVFLLSQVLAVCAMLLALLAPGWSTAIFILLGLGMGGGLVSALPLAAEILHRPGAMGAAVGLYNLAYMVGGILGAAVVGWVVEASSYRSLFMVTGLFAVAGILFTVLLGGTVRVPQSTQASKIGQPG